MLLLEVKDKKLAKRWLEVPVKIYADDPIWVRPLDKDLERVFDPEKNRFFKYGEATRWILNDGRRDIGRVAAFINRRTAEAPDNEQPTGGMGFFECINDQQAANALMDGCRDWLAARGMGAMDGPINFGERDAWWGVLAEGFTQPTYQMNYNPPYYVDLLKGYGFQLYFRQFVYYRNLLDPVQEKIEEKYRHVMQEGGYTFRHIEKKAIGKYTADFRTVYNEAWGKHPGFKEMSEVQAKTIMKVLKPIMVPWLIWFGYYKERPVSFFVMIPDINPVIRKFNGRFGLVNKLRLWWRINMTRKHHNCYGVVFGVVPDFQGRGVDGAIVKAASFVVHPKKQYDHMEMVWVGDFNPKMVRVCEDVGGELYKTYYTMRYLFDRTKEFKRHPMIH